MGTSARLAEPDAKRRVDPERLAAQQAALRRVATLVAGGAPSPEVFDAVAREVAEVLQVTHASICRYDEDGSAMTVLAAVRQDPYRFPPGSRWPLDGPSMSREVFRTGRPARIEHYRDLPGTVAAEARKQGFERVAGAPIIVGGRVWGVIATISPEAPFPDDLEERLAEFTELVATAIGNSEAHDNLARIGDEQAALRRVATRVAEGAKPNDVFAAIADEVAGTFGVPIAVLVRYDPDGMATVLATVGRGFSPVGGSFPVERPSLTAAVLRAGTSVRLDDWADIDDPAAALARENGVRWAVGVPIVVNGALWGLIAVAAPDTAGAAREVEERLAKFTELFAMAVANSEAQQERARLADEQAALRRVATLVASGASPNDVFEAVSKEVAALIPADGSALTRFEGDGSVTALSGWTAAGGYKYVGHRYDVEGTVSGLILETGRPGRIDNYGEAPGEASEAAREMGWRSSVGAPITVEGHLWGVLAVISKREEPLPPDTERRLVEFTELVATAIANTEAHQELARLADEQAALRRVATLAARGVPPGEVFEAVSTEVAQLVGADGAGVTRFEADGTFRALGGWAGTGGYPYTGRQFPLEGSISGLVLERRRPSRIDDFEDRPGEAPAAMAEMGWRSAMGAPIWVGGSLWGVLVIYSKRTEPFPPDTERRLGEFTEIVATAIASAEGREEISRLAEVQAALRQVATMVAEGSSPTEVFQAIAAEVGRLIPADLAGLGRYTPDGTLTVLGSWTQSGRPFGPEVGMAFPLEPGTTSARVFSTQQPARTDSYDHVPPGRLADSARENDWRSTVGVPVLVEGRPWGLVIVGSTTDVPLSADTETRLMEFTELLATAIANAESRTELDASRARIVATADATRRRIERDLHDGAQQQLVSLALEVRAAQANAPEEMAEHRDDLSHIAEGLTTVLDGLREIALGIHPAILAEGGLGPTLKTLAHRSPIPVELDVRADTRLPEVVEVAAYYVVSEALTNAAKHSEASKVEVAVGINEGMLRVTVRDDGAGGADHSRGSGLLGLKDRAEAIGGSISIVSPRGIGTTLIAELPLDVTPPAAR